MNWHELTVFDCSGDVKDLKWTEMTKSFIGHENVIHKLNTLSLLNVHSSRMFWSHSNAFLLPYWWLLINPLLFFWFSFFLLLVCSVVLVMCIKKSCSGGCLQSFSTGIPKKDAMLMSGHAWLHQSSKTAFTAHCLLPSGKDKTEVDVDMQIKNPVLCNTAE